MSLTLYKAFITSATILFSLSGSVLPLPPARAQAAPPDAIEAIARGTNEIRIYWNAVPGASRYLVYRDDVEIASIDAATHEYADAHAEPGRTYRYNVAAVYPDGVRALGQPYLEQAYPILPDETHCDVLVVGGTSAGVAAAVTAARYGLHVVLIEETRRLGGMPVNGLGETDLRRITNASGFFEEFRRRVVQIYGEGNGLEYEPRVAHQAMKALLWSASGLLVYQQVRPVKVVTRDAKVVEVLAEVTTSGRRVRFFPRLVVDATECGDVAAWAGAPFRVGREPRSAREPHAGYIYYDRAGDRPLAGSTGRGDPRVQAYAYLMTVQDYGPGADKTIPKPPGYDPHKYEHAVPWDKSWAVTSGVLPHHKFEVNQHPQGSDLQGVNYAYPTATYAVRRHIESLYRDHALGYLYYIQTVEGKKNIGLSEDDYRESDNWPPLLYIREARRFEADTVLDESDIVHARNVARSDAIGLGDYPMDSHAVEPKTDWTTPDMGEGEFYLPQYTPWHQVPYHVMIPKRVENVFVPTAVSATHVAYGTLRLEPTRMHFGEAAGIAAYLCLTYGYTPRTVPVRQIQAELLKRRSGGPGDPARAGIGAAGPNENPAYLYLFSDVTPETRKFAAIQWLAARGFYPCPPPAERTPSSGLTAAPFQPDAPLTEQEAVHLLQQLANRQTADGNNFEDQKLRPPSIADYRPPDILTRGAAARMIAGFMGWTAPPNTTHYADLTTGSAEQIAAESLYATWIDSRLWDGAKAFAPGGKLLFAPEKPLTRAQFAELICLAHLHFGPLWEDDPADRSIEREIPLLGETPGKQTDRKGALPARRLTEERLFR